MKPFKSSRIKITLPLTNKILKKLERSEKYSYLLDDLRFFERSDHCTDAYCEMTVIFNLKRHKTHFWLHTCYIYLNGDLDVSSVYADFDGDMAEYMKTEAVKAAYGALPKTLV